AGPAHRRGQAKRIVGADERRRSRISGNDTHYRGAMAAIGADRRDRVERHVVRAGVHEQYGAAFGALAHDLPGLAAFVSSQDRSEIANNPTALLVEEKDAMQWSCLACRLSAPGGAGVARREHNRAGPADDPGVLADAVNRLKIDTSRDFFRHLQIGEAPG